MTDRHAPDDAPLDEGEQERRWHLAPRRGINAGSLVPQHIEILGQAHLRPMEMQEGRIVHGNRGDHAPEFIFFVKRGEAEFHQSMVSREQIDCDRGARKRMPPSGARPYAGWMLRTRLHGWIRGVSRT